MKWPMLVALAGAMAASCGGDDGASAAATAQASPGEALVASAAERMPDLLALHTVVFARTCSPDEGVCHNAKEYPDLHTPGNLLDAIEKPCNLAEEQPADVHDLCEPLGDLLVIESGPLAGFTSRIEWLAEEGRDLAIRLADDVGGCAPHQAAFRIAYGDGSDETVLAVGDPALTVPCDGPDVRVFGFGQLDEQARGFVLRRIRSGDPNRNTKAGFELGGALVAPGDPARSYMLQRLLGTVPGSPMPLANQPLDDAEFLALACWIETLDSDPEPKDLIDYDACEAATRARTEGGPVPGDAGLRFGEAVEGP